MAAQAASAQNASAPPASGRPALLLVGHGTRDTAGQAEFLRLAELVCEERAHEVLSTPAGSATSVAAQAPLVEPCFLELAEPTITTGVARLLAAGARQITVAPLLLFSAGHAQRDVPAAVAAALASHQRADIELRQAAPLDAVPALVELSAQRFREAFHPSSFIPHPSDTLAVLVARGSHDPLALANLERFAAAWRAATGIERTLVGFAAMATPTLAEALAEAGRSEAQQVVVVRHFLFPGELPRQVEAAAAAAATAHPAQTWRTTGVLGADRLLAQAVLARVREVEGPG